MYCHFNCLFTLLLTAEETCVFDFGLVDGNALACLQYVMYYCNYCIVKALLSYDRSMNIHRSNKTTSIDSDTNNNQKFDTGTRSDDSNHKAMFKMVLWIYKTLCEWGSWRILCQSSLRSLASCNRRVSTKITRVEPTFCNACLVHAVQCKNDAIEPLFNDAL